MIHLYLLSLSHPNDGLCSMIRNVDVKKHPQSNLEIRLFYTWIVEIYYC